MRNTRLYEPVSSVRRNLFLGAQSGVFAVGNAYSKLQQGRSGKDNLMSWYEDSDDYGNENGIAVVVSSESTSLYSTAKTTLLSLLALTQLLTKSSNNVNR
jgi:hypothetical protein